MWPAGCGKDPPAAGGSSSTVLAPVPAPVTLAADVFLTSPEATWAKVRGLINAPAAFVPQSFGGLVASLLGFPITAVAEIDGGVPVLGAVLAPQEGTRPRGVLAIHVKEGTRFLELLTRGESARFATEVDLGSSITMVVQKGGSGGPYAMGVLGNYLLVAQTRVDLLEGGPYAARTLPTAPVPKEELVLQVGEAALDGPVRPWMAQGAKRLDELPAALQQALAPVRGVLESAGDLSSARLAAAIGDASTRVQVTLVPRAGTRARAFVDELDVGDLGPLLGLPADTLAAVVLRDAGKASDQALQAQVATIAGVLGMELPEKDRAQLSGALGELASVTGDWVSAGVSLGPTGPAGYFGAEVKDEARFWAAGGALGAFLDKGPGKALLAGHAMRAKGDKTKLENFAGDVGRIRISRTEGAPTAAAKDQGLPAAVDVLYTVRDGKLLAVASTDAPAALRRLASSGKLESSASAKAAAERLGGGMALTVFLEPLLMVASRAGRPGAGESAPVLFGYGREGDKGGPMSVRVDASNLAVREAIKQRAVLAP
ncbi:MAG: hypothetical protein WKG00_37795 [Polyangiaceae bacterium]